MKSWNWRGSLSLLSLRSISSCQVKKVKIIHRLTPTPPLSRCTAGSCTYFQSQTEKKKKSDKRRSSSNRRSRFCCHHFPICWNCNVRVEVEMKQLTWVAMKSAKNFRKFYWNLIFEIVNFSEFFKQFLLTNFDFI